jgi:hypothetical protein
VRGRGERRLARCGGAPGRAALLGGRASPAGACDEKALVEWAGREGLRFEVTDAVDLQRRPAGRMFHLRSYTDEEVAFHRRKLEEAPKPACPGENVIARLGYHWSP